MHLVSAEKDKSSVFHVKDVNVKIGSLAFSVRDSKHDKLYNMLRPLATGLVKKQIQKALRDAITTGLEYVDGQLVGVRDRMNEAKASDETSRAQVLQQLFQSKKEKAQSVKSNTNAQFKVVAKRDSAILPDAGHPSGLVNRQADRADAAKAGSGWHSPAYAFARLLSIILHLRVLLSAASPSSSPTRPPAARLRRPRRRPARARRRLRASEPEPSSKYDKHPSSLNSLITPFPTRDELLMILLLLLRLRLRR